MRLTDVKAEHYERKVQSLEAERDEWEKKYEEVSAKLKAAEDELTKIQQELEGL